MSASTHGKLKFTTDKLVVLMPAFNASEFIREAIGSILEQSFSDFDLLIIDDRSTDETADIVRSHEDPRIHLIQRSVNGGIVEALNSGLDLVQHQFIARMDADDRSLPQRFELQMRFLEQHPEVDLLGTHLVNFGVEAAEWDYPTDHDRIKARFLFGNAFPHASLMARAAVFRTERYSARVPHMEDYELWLRLIPEHRFAILPDRLYAYRRHEEGVTVAFRKTRRERLKVLLREPLRWLQIEPTENELHLLAGDNDALDGGYAEHIGTYHALLQKIRLANVKHKVFADAALDELLNYRWRRFFYLLGSSRPRTLLKYWKLSGGVSVTQLRYAMSGLIRTKK